MTQSVHLLPKIRAKTIRAIIRELVELGPHGPNLTLVLRGGSTLRGRLLHADPDEENLAVVDTQCDETAVWFLAREDVVVIRIEDLSDPGVQAVVTGMDRLIFEDAPSGLEVMRMLQEFEKMASTRIGTNISARIRNDTELPRDAPCRSALRETIGVLTRFFDDCGADQALADAVARAVKDIELGFGASRSLDVRDARLDIQLDVSQGPAGRFSDAGFRAAMNAFL